MKMNMTPRAKKLLAGLTAAALTLSMLPATALAAKDYATGGETALRFSNSGITVQEGDYDGYKIDGTELTINAAGTYVLSGSCADGSVTVKKGTTGVVLVLDGLTLTCGDSAAIACNKSTEVTIVAADGTVNTLADTEQNNDETYPDNDSAENAVIKCKDGSQVTLCGSGTLNVTANGKNGVKSGATTDEEGAASLTIRELTLNIDAPVNDAVNAEQQLNIESGSLTISAGDDALHCDLSLTVGASGTAGPDIDITGCYEGIEAANLAIRSGDIDITATDDCLNAANSDLTGYSFTMDISGSTINAYTSGGDGFDSNGSRVDGQHGGQPAPGRRRDHHRQRRHGAGRRGQQRHGHEPERQPALCALWLHRRHGRRQRPGPAVRPGGQGQHPDHSGRQRKQRIQRRRPLQRELCLLLLTQADPRQQLHSDRRQHHHHRHSPDGDHHLQPARRRPAA